MDREIDGKLSLLFDYQMFERNEELQRVIDKVSARFPSRMLSDDEADLVNAAGTIGTELLRQKPRKKENGLP